METIGAIFKAIAAYFGWAQKRQDLNNSPQMQAAKSGQIEADATSKEEKTVQSHNVTDTRNELAE